ESLEPAEAGNQRVTCRQHSASRRMANKYGRRARGTRRSFKFGLRVRRADASLGATFGMAFNLKKVLKALLLSTNQPLAIKDIQAAFTRFHEQASLPFGTAEESDAGGAEAKADGAALEGGAPVNNEAGSEAGAASAEVSPEVAESLEAAGIAKDAQEEVAAEEGAQDPELYGDVPSLITATQIREAMDQIAAELRASDDGLLLIEG